MFAARADLPQSLVESLVQLVDFSQKWAKQQEFHSDVRVAAAAQNSRTSNINTLLNMVQALKMPLSWNSMWVCSKERDTGFELSVFKPSEWVEVLRLRSALTGNWPLHPVGTPQEVSAGWTAGFASHLAETHFPKSNSTTPQVNATEQAIALKQQRCYVEVDGRTMLNSRSPCRHGTGTHSHSNDDSDLDISGQSSDRQKSVF